MTDTPKWRLETREDIDGGTYKAWTDEPIPAHQRATEALSALTERANMAGVRLTYTAIVNAVLPPAFDVDEMVRVLADHQLVVGPHGLTRYCTCGVDIEPIGELVHHQAEAIRTSIVGEA